MCILVRMVILELRKTPMEKESLRVINAIKQNILNMVVNVLQVGTMEKVGVR